MNNSQTATAEINRLKKEYATFKKERDKVLADNNMTLGDTNDDIDCIESDMIKCEDDWRSLEQSATAEESFEGQFTVLHDKKEMFASLSKPQNI